MTTPQEYSENTNGVAGCTCYPKRIIRELDDKGSFVIEHEHRDGCAKIENAKRWGERAKGLATADTRTLLERQMQRAEALGQRRLL